MRRGQLRRGSFLAFAARAPDAVFEPVDVKVHALRRALYIAASTSGTIYRYSLGAQTLRMDVADEASIAAAAASLRSDGVSL